MERDTRLMLSGAAVSVADCLMQLSCDTAVTVHRPTWLVSRQIHMVSLTLEVKHIQMHLRINKLHLVLQLELVLL